jgi:hypothetical protein
MKKNVFIFISLVLLSCSDKPVPKPDHLLSVEEMENITYDMAILQASETYKPNILGDNDIKIRQYIYKKYSIDSTIYYQNYKYFASEIKSFKKIYNSVNDRIQNKKNEIDTIIKTKNLSVPEEVPTYLPQIK